MADATKSGLEGKVAAGRNGGEQRLSSEYSRWTVEPNVGRVVDGVSTWLVEPDIPRVISGEPNRENRLKALGNAIVPQVTEFIGRQIVDVEALK